MPKISLTAKDGNVYGNFTHMFFVVMFFKQNVCHKSDLRQKIYNYIHVLQRE